MESKHHGFISSVTTNHIAGHHRIRRNTADHHHPLLLLAGSSMPKLLGRRRGRSINAIFFSTLGVSQGDSPRQLQIEPSALMLQILMAQTALPPK
nr:hypothetical protein Iba_chr06cCG10410 [Ipomoea batatas]GMD10592.1 hypothetical protein Iba_chr06eCG7730 [Ipomoea batatas]GMD11901.1 hypothetical protein Iba_chr06fCG8090 [Ipomoea batatas]GMD11903.1 hypothetical protein Iba_chr06fCG8110 [Ipomoea batatas]